MVIWAVYNPAAAISAEDDQVFVEMINQIRRDPYDYASNYLECTPEFLKTRGIEPDTTFDDYTLDDGLTVMAEAESHETESQSNAGEEISESEEPPDHRFRLTASTGGVVSFFNFMSRETAFKIVIDYLFKEELDSNTVNHILSEKYSYVGIAISAGKVGSANAWFVAISLGSAELVSEIQMLNLINQVRADPESIWEYTDSSPADVWGQNLSELIYSEYKYKPLFFDASLSAYAQAHSFYKLNEMYPEEALSETQTPLERAKYYKYEGEVVQEHYLKKLYSSTEKNDRSVYKFFLSWIEKELKDVSSPCSTVVFSKDFEDVGYNITFQSGGEIYDYDVSAFSFVVGKKETNTSNEENADRNPDQISKIYGVLFSGNDVDDLYAPGEELIQKTVMAYDDEMQEVETAVTDNAGHFSMKLKTNRQYRFVATIDDVLVEKEGVFITSDQFVKLVYSPPPIEDDLLTVDIQ